MELLDETMMLQCTSKADMEDWVWDMNRLRGGGVDQNIGGYPAGHDIYEGLRERGERERGGGGEREGGEGRGGRGVC